MTTRARLFVDLRAAIAAVRWQVDAADAETRVEASAGVLDDGREFETRFPGGYTARITQQIVDAGVEDFDVDGQQEAAWANVLINLLPFVLAAARTGASPAPVMRRAYEVS